MYITIDYELFHASRTYIFDTVLIDLVICPLVYD